MKVPLLVLVLTWVTGFFLLNAQTVFTYRSPESENDSRYDYDNALLRLALEKTEESHGSFSLEASPVMNYTRAHKTLLEGSFENSMFKLSATNEFTELFDYVNFPVDLGIVGYRVFFTSPEIKNMFEQETTLNGIKKYTIIQGYGWTDSEILRSAGFTVFEVAKYESLFPMITNNRADLLSRGVNEVKGEMENHRDIENLEINKNIVLYYPLPRFFFTTKGNEDAVNRVYKGLEIAYKDGSLLELWKKYYQESLDFTDLDNRTIIKIPNPTISNIDESFNKYLYNLKD